MPTEIRELSRELPPRKPGDGVIEKPIGDDKTGSSIAAVVDLGSDFYEEYSWSNNKDDFPLDTYFDPTKPNVGREYGLPGLQPMLKDKDGDLFILKDAQNHYYQWSLWDGAMWRLITKETDPNTVAMMVLRGIPSDQLVRQYNPKTVR